MVSYRLLKRADNDLLRIANYTIERFGIEQARVYRDGLFVAFDTIAGHPMIGSDQSHIRPNVRRHVYESHAIYYRTVAREVVILRIAP